MTENTLTYVGKLPCGCIRFATCAKDRKILAKDISQAIEGGLAVEPMDIEKVRHDPWKCEEHRKPEEVCR